MTVKYGSYHKNIWLENKIGPPETICVMNNLVKYRIAASAFFFIQGFSVTSWVCRLPDIKAGFSLSDQELGVLLMALPAGQLTAMPFSGGLVKRYGSCRIARIGALVLPCWLTVLGLIPNRVLLFAALFLFGMAINLSNIAINTQGVGIERLYGKSILASFHGIWSLGGIGAILLSSYLAAQGISPKVNFVCAAALLISVYILNYRNLLPNDSRNTEGSGQRFGVLKLIKDPFLWIFGIISFGGMGCEGIMNNWTSIYFKETLGVRTEYIRVGLLVFMTAVTCSRFTADWFVRKWGGIVIIRLAGCLIMAGFILMTVFSDFAIAAAGCALVGFGTSAIVPVCFGLVGKYGAVPVAVAITMVASIGFLGFLIMPPLAGFISGQYSLRAALFLAGFLAFLAAQLVVLTRATVLSGKSG